MSSVVDLERIKADLQEAINRIQVVESHVYGKERHNARLIEENQQLKRRISELEHRPSALWFSTMVGVIIGMAIIIGMMQAGWI